MSFKIKLRNSSSIITICKGYYKKYTKNEVDTIHRYAYCEFVKNCDRANNILF